VHDRQFGAFFIVVLKCSNYMLFFIFDKTISKPDGKHKYK